MTPSVSAFAALAAGLWLLRRDGAWDTYHTPLFWPFLFAAGIMAVFSTTDAPAETQGWRGLVARCAAAGAVVAGLAALVVSQNPIYDLHARDMFAFAASEALLIVAAGAATELGERYRPGTWIRTAWCAAAAMAMLALIPSLLLVVHERGYTCRAGGALGTEPLRDVVEYYEQYAEESRLEQGPSRLEFERTRDILTRVLPPPPARVVDIGGAAGVYSAWLAAGGYDVRLLDRSPRLVAEARKRNGTLTHKIAALDVGDARALPYEDGSADVVLIMGPLYHLPARDDRLAALREALRVLVPGGVIAVAAISRFASALDGLARGLATDPAFVQMRDRDLADGQHRNPTGKADYFTTAYLHRPEELASELAASGCLDTRVLGVEGPAWLVADFDTRWANPVLRDDMMAVARAVEAEPAMLGVSAHLLGIGRKAPR